MLLNRPEKKTVLLNCPEEETVLISSAAIVCGFALDLCLADPLWMPHPVVWMGKYISRMEPVLRKYFPATPAGEFTGGFLLAVSLPALTFALAWGICRTAEHLHPVVSFAVQTLWSWQTLSLKGLADESRHVYDFLTRGNLPGARNAVGRIVGRDTAKLDEPGIVCAAVESVSENFCDGVTAPMFYLFLGGAPLAMAYKAVNTLDSMIGYRTAQYLYFGRTGAKLDDAANYIPSRIAALCWICAAGLCGYNAKGAWNIWRRDRNKSASPNAAQTESACAGALGIQLGGTAYYFGKRCDKAYLGDPLRPVNPTDILRANKMLYTAGILLLCVLCLLRFLLWKYI